VARAADAEEDDGFLLTVVYDGPNDASDLVILDAANVDAEPLAVAHLEHRIPMGFHGNFVPGLV
jgi:carotenoid cleavage dioxygenase-like enzyme